MAAHRWRAARLRERFTGAVFVGLLADGEFPAADEAMDLVVHSFEEAAAEAAVALQACGGVRQVAHPACARPAGAELTSLGEACWKGDSTQCAFLAPR